MTDTKTMKARFWMDVYLVAIKELGVMQREMAERVADKAVEQLENRIGAET